jgi:hypothetical protein
MYRPFSFHLTLRLISFVCVLFGFLFAYIVPAYAQGLSVRVQPSTIEEQLDPGETIEGTITVTNKNGGKQTYFIDTRNVMGMNDTGTPTFSNEKSDDPLEAASWITVSQELVSLDVEESIQVPYTITVPENASPGSYFAAFFVTREADKTVQSGAGVGFHVASLVNLRVNGEVNEDMLFREFFTEKSFFTQPNVYFKARVDNVGTIHQRPRGIITIKDMFGNEIGKTTFNDSAGAILPRHDRVFETTWTDDGFAIGRYTAVASILFGETNKNTLTREVSFWIVPLKEIGIVFGILALILLVFIYGVKRYIRNALKEAGAGEKKAETKKNITLARKMIQTAIRTILVLLVLFIVLVVYNA